MNANNYILVPAVKTLANHVDGQRGYGAATEIKFADVSEPTVESHTDYGYRKKTTGEYVPNKYRANFGWKNTYYQQAKTVVVLPLAI